MHVRASVCACVFVRVYVCTCVCECVCQFASHPMDESSFGGVWVCVRVCLGE